MRNINVTYYMHSGFSYETNGKMLIFDYWEGEGRTLPEEKRLTVEKLKEYEHVYVFISHSHPDHFDPVVYEWGKDVPITYIIGYDLPLETRGNRLHPGDVLKIDGMTVCAYDSTDLGISFLIDIDEIHIFHAGDLNFWHWREESTVQEIEEAEEAFKTAVTPIIGQNIDLCFFPVDPRQGRLYDAGANYFMMSVKPRLFIPMHFWEKGDVMQEFARRSRSNQTEVIALTHPGEMMNMEVDDDGYMTVNLIEPERPVQPQAHDRAVNLESYEGNDPFINTDMPVELDQM